MSLKYSTACPNWRDLLLSGESIIPEPLFASPADHAEAIFKKLRIGDLPGKPTFGEVCKPWVFRFVRAVFGGYDPDTGDQLIKEYGLLIAKKNTKSTIGAGIMMTALLMCWRENEEHLIISPTKEISDNSFGAAAAMVRADPELSALLTVKDHYKTIVHNFNRNSLKVVAASVKSASGKKAARVLVDELWVFGKYEWAEAMLMEATGGQIARPEGFTVYLTTQSEETPAGVFKNKLEYWRNVRDGVVEDNTVLPVIYEFPEDMIENGAFMQPENFHLVNPNLGASVSKQWLETNLKKVTGMRDGSFQKFIAKHLNVEIKNYLTNNKWAGAEFWAGVGDKRLTLGELIDRSEVVCCGIDGGGLDDLLGFAVIGRERGTGRWLHWGHAWCHRIALERNSANRQKLLEFVADGDLTLVDKPGDDVVDLICCIQKVQKLLPAKAAIGVDAAGITAIADALIDSGIDVEQIRTVPQGWQMNGPIKTVERMVAGEGFVHGGSRLMEWCVTNARVNQNGNAVSITKQISNGKIDPLMALFDAVVMMGQNPAATAKRSRNKGLVLGVLG